jgi:dCMP deaminase
MSKDNSRPAWDDIWMKVAHAISERSIDPRYKVGAVIVSDDNTQVLSVGYNGDQSGGSNLV